MAVVVRSQANQAETIPNGVYAARLTGIRQFENAYGQRLGFEFTLQGGELDGTTIMRSTSTNLSPKGKLNELIRGLRGRDLAQHEAELGFDLEELVGTECNVLVSQARGKNGQVYSNVEQVFR